jgi:hypothetical protein
MIERTDGATRIVRLRDTEETALMTSDKYEEIRQKFSAK